MPGPTGGGGMNVDEKLAILIKSYELEPLPKLALEVGEKATVDLLHSGQYLGHLIRAMNLEFIGFDREVTFLDRETAMLVRDDPVSGFSHYLVDHGVARVFGRELHEGKVPLEPAIGAASAIGIVEKDMDGTTKVFTKKQLGLKNEPLREIAKKFYRPGGVENEYSRAKDIQHETQIQKEPFEYIAEELEKKKRKEESEIEPTWMMQEELKEIQDEEEQEERKEVPEVDYNQPREIDILANPDIVAIDQENELMYPSWVDEKELKRKERLEQSRRSEFERRVKENDYALQQMIEEDEYILPFDFKKEGETEGDRNEGKKEEDDDDYLVPF